VLTLRAADGKVVCARVRLASSFGQRLRGLMGRATLAPDEGLYLPGSSGIHMLFMRFAIDCIFVGRPDAAGDMRVVELRRALPPWRGVVWHVRGAAGVFELAVGTVDRADLSVGDLVRLE
jgi:uncharacterized protein